MPESLSKRIISLVGGNRLEEALDLFKDTPVANDAILLQRRLKQSKKEHSKGILSRENYLQELNQIGNSILELAKELSNPHSDPLPLSKKSQDISPEKPFGHLVYPIIQLVLYLAAIGFLVYGFILFLKDFRVSQLPNFLPYLIPIGLVLAGYTLPAWLRRKKKQYLIDLKDEIIPPDYFRLTPYEAKDADTFTRADGMHESVLQWLEEGDNGILYLSGESGTGKSSLLSGYVIPKLNDTEIIEIRGYTNPVQALKKELATRKLGHEAEISTRHLLEAYLEIISRRCLLIFDQFEEFLILREEQEQEELEALLLDLQTHPIQDLSVLLVFRSDYLSEILKLDIPELEPNKNWKVVGPFNERDARQFLEGSGMQLDGEIIKSILEEAQSLDGKNGLIRPIILNMYGMILSRYLGKLPEGVAPDELLKSYLEESVNLPNFEGDAKAIMQTLITKKGTKRPQSVEEVAELTKLDQAVIKGFFLELVPKGIVRRIDQARQIWEVSHDFLALLLHRSLFSWQLPRFSKIAKWGTPILMLLWITGMFFIVPQWQKENIIKKLDEIGFAASLRSEGGYKVQANTFVNDSQLTEGVSLMNELGTITDLSFRSSQVSDISSLSTLTSLTYLFLFSNPVSDISSLSTLTSLTYLNLGSNQVSDISSLSTLTSLTDLNLGYNQVSDISSLSTLTSLTDLDLSSNPVSDISSLSTLTSLTYLNLGSNQVSDISSLSTLTSLTDLNLGYNQVSDISSLSTLTSLTDLDLSSNPVSDISSLSTLTSLTKLELSNIQVSDFSPLSTLTSLTDLYLRSNPVSDISSLSTLTSLTSLYLSDNQGDSIIVHKLKAKGVFVRY